MISTVHRHISARAICVVHERVTERETLETKYVAEFVCKLAKAQGSCGAFTTRWWFNAAIASCEEFTYSGCKLLVFQNLFTSFFKELKSFFFVL
jgi:hypothetical protein